MVALATLFFGSALITPQLNPITRPFLAYDAESASYLAGALGDLALLRHRTEEYVGQEGRWPTDLADTGHLLQAGYFAYRSPAPYQIEATLLVSGLDTPIKGAQLVVTYDPATGQWRCRPGATPLPSRYTPANCRDAPPSDPMTVLWGLLLACVLAFLVVAALVLFRHPLIAPIQRTPRRLLRMPIDDLPRIDRLLRGTLRRRAVLGAARVRDDDWHDALRVAGADAVARDRRFAPRVTALSQSSSGWSLPGAVFAWRFPVELPISLERCLAYFPDPEIGGDALVRHLRQCQTGLDVMLVFVPGADTERSLREFCADRANPFVAVDRETQTEWLLDGDAVAVLLRALARQLRVTRVSPYQTRGGVSRPSSFFGREQMLARVIQREPGNFLVVGGRQLGKTSLLKAIDRRLRDHPQVRCHYLVLRDQRLAPRLAAIAEAAPDADIETAVAALRSRAGGRRLMILIDEADPFFRADAEGHYAQLSTLRALSEEGQVHFMLAGFWDLYAAALLDYQSPLRNFGELLVVGGLESEACRELATVPMASLGLRYAEDALVDRIVARCGRRANLIAIVCHECLEALTPGEAVIEARHVDLALHSQAALDALAGWGRLSNDADDSACDRFIVYACALHGPRSLGDLVELAAAGGGAVGVDRLKTALTRLQLAFVLRADDQRYGFAVPLFERQFERGELPLLLQQETDRLAAVR
jgi:hypothetical protein